MMFCSTFLSAPSDELLDGASDVGGCLAPLHCLVLPQDELYTPFSDAAANLRHSVVMGQILMDVSLGGRDVSPSPVFRCRERETAGRL